MSDVNNFRSQLGASKMEDLKSQTQEVARPVKKAPGEKITYLHLKPGINRVRFYPAHPGERSFIFSKHVNYLAVERLVFDNEGKPVMSGDDFVKEVKRLPIHSALVHSDVKGQDLVDLYIRTIKVLIRDEADGDDEVFKKKWAIVTHWQNGITGKIAWQAWADNVHAGKSEFGLLEISNATKAKIDKLVMAGDDAEGMIATDPFTDPDQGRVVVITYDPTNVVLADRYTVALDYMKPTPLTDEGIEQFMKFPPLAKMLRDTFYQDTFEKQVEGLKRFDDQHKFGVFENEEFMENLTAMATLFKPRPSTAPTQDAVTGDMTAGPTQVVPAATEDAPAPVVKTASAKATTSKAATPAGTGRFTKKA